MSLDTTSMLFLFHLITYWASCFVLMIGLGHLPLIVPTRRKTPSKSKVLNAAAISLLNQALSYPLILIVLPYCLNTDSTADNGNTWWWRSTELVIALLIYTISADHWFYWTHRVLHYPPLFRRIHYIHHQWVYPVAVSALYAHPVEHLLCSVGAILIGPLLYPASEAVIILWTAIVTVNAVLAHCGIDIPYFNNEKHDLHHRYLSCNYGTVGTSDALYGTTWSSRQLVRAQALLTSACAPNPRSIINNAAMQTVEHAFDIAVDAVVAVPVTARRLHPLRLPLLHSS